MFSAVLPAVVTTTGRGVQQRADSQEEIVEIHRNVLYRWTVIPLKHSFGLREESIKHVFPFCLEMEA